MSAFTPGPWAIDPDDRIDMEWNNHIVRADDPNIAICFMSHTGTSDNSECEANAKLIAAAPELLEALEKLVAAELAPAEKFGIEEIEFAMMLARSAIAKATA